jgi:hypothetical protein
MDKRELEKFSTLKCPKCKRDQPDSIADTGEFWATILIIYFLSLIPLSVGYMGWQIRRERE